MILRPPEFAPLGDSAITIRFGEGASDELSRAVFRAAQALASARIDGADDIVPAYAVLTVFYDPVAVSYDDMLIRIQAALPDGADAADDSQTPPATLVRIPVRYDGEDLDNVSRTTGLSTKDLIELHSGGEYRALVIGFVPGFAYLGTLDPRLSCPRLASPRKHVRPGSVAIADLQTAVYPSATPGGWNIIGHTETVMFDAMRDTPALLRVGDRVKFDPVDL